MAEIELCGVTRGSCTIAGEAEGTLAEPVDDDEGVIEALAVLWEGLEVGRDVLPDAFGDR